MNELTVINQNGQLTIDSREVAAMIDVRHADLLEKINNYIQYLDNGKFRSADFFIPSSYNTGTRDYLCYLITRKGCDMVANKLTGEKGVLFTAAYVTKFEEMERAQKPGCIEDLIIMQAQSMKEIRTQVKRIADTQQAIKDAVISEPDNWRRDIYHKMNRIAKSIGPDKFKDVRTESYKLLDERAHADLNRRLFNYRARLLAQGQSKTAIDKANVMDIIDQDPKLREIYGKIVAEYLIKYCA